MILSNLLEDKFLQKYKPHKAKEAERAAYMIIPLSSSIKCRQKTKMSHFIRNVYAIIHHTIIKEIQSCKTQDLNNSLIPEQVNIKSIIMC